MYGKQAYCPCLFRTDALARHIGNTKMQIKSIYFYKSSHTWSVQTALVKISRQIWEIQIFKVQENLSNKAAQ